ncbi:hypothetical protein LOAG_03423 [Loa loa]|uniref:ATPase inhibitor, mitochondrial n=1 Tax=Loa loa TaxID=7209 RepID=A0A1S0U4G4_LOALO|nr:hypothetical protein LOAG_03423 [Loa loa]EFO25066.2 hypothetical protein LOAG_03423 [Loa loa]
MDKISRTDPSYFFLVLHSEEKDMSGNFDGSINDPNATDNAGSIREAGGAFGRMGIAREEQYFYDQQKEAMKNLNSTLKNVKEVIHSKDTDNEHSDQSNQAIRS